MPFFKRLAAVLDMIKFHHTVFALPFALLAMAWAAKGWPGWRVALGVLLAMVGARSAAMTFNRLADRKYDVLNPRTSRWPLSTGVVSLPFAWGFFAVSVAVLFAAAWWLNPICFALSPLALAVILGYSYTKRFTPLCHLILGFADGISAPGAWIAVTGTLEGSAPAWWLCAALTAWIGGFDTIYALQDRTFDKAQGLHSWPARFGVASTLWVSAALHVAAVVCLGVAGWSVGGGWMFWAALVAAAAALLYEHLIVRPSDLSRINAAFFTVNGYISIGLFLAGLGDLWLRSR
jgi:4-hydroxybenzoate polyprenyltransferase